MDGRTSASGKLEREQMRVSRRAAQGRRPRPRRAAVAPSRYNRIDHDGGAEAADRAADEAPIRSGRQLPIDASARCLDTLDARPQERLIGSSSDTRVLCR